MYIEGIVTAQDYILGTFTLNKVKVHCAYKFINNDQSFVIPPLAEKVRLHDVIKIDNSNVVLTKYTNVEFSGIAPSKSVERNFNFCKIFADLVMTYKLKPCDIIFIDNVQYPFSYSDEFLNQIACKSVFSGTLQKHLTVRTVEYLLNLCTGQTQFEKGSNRLVFETKLKDFKIYGPEYFKIDQNILKEPIYWHYRNVRSKKFELLAGYLSAEPKLGFLSLRNEEYEIKCIILKEDNNIISDYSIRVEKILNKFVLMKKYRIFTEYYDDVIPVQYLVVNIYDIFVLETAGDFITYSPTNQIKYWYPKNKNMENFNITIRILHRSTVKKCNDYRLKFTLHCIVLSHDNLECVLQFTTPLVVNYLIFNENDIFILRTKQRCFKRAIESRKSNNNLTINKRSIPSFNVPNDIDVSFQSNSEYTGPEGIPVRSIKEATNILKNTLSCYKDINIISLEGILVQRKFSGPLRNAKKVATSNFGTPDLPAAIAVSNSNCFGTPGLKVHQLILKENDPRVAESQVALEQTGEVEKYYEKAVLACAKYKIPIQSIVYLHDWESLQCPLGLIPGMTLRIKYILKQKEKYFKPIKLTCIEVVKYDASLENFSSFLNNQNWGFPYPLGLGKNVAANCICVSTTEIIAIKYLKFSTMCKHCGKTINKGQASCCEKLNVELKLLVILNVVDEGGRSNVVVKDENLLRILLKQSENEWIFLKLAFLNLRSLEFSISDTEDDPNETYENAFKYFFRDWNDTGIHNFEMKCRKLSQNMNNNPKWFLLEVKEAE